jgi:hypothetical protein
MKKKYIALLLLMFNVFAYADVLQVTPDKDNSIFEPGNLSNGVGDDLFSGNSFQGAGFDTKRALLHFDISTIPSGSTINSVSLNLNLNRSNRSGTILFSLHSVSQDWGEGLSNASVLGGGMGATSLNGDASWLCAFDDGAGGCTTSWGSVGGDFNPVASQTLSITNVLGVHAFTTSAGLVADVQSWIDSGNNFGWILIADEAVIASVKRFSSREDAVVANRPQLTIDYTPPVPVELMNFSID